MKTTSLLIVFVFIVGVVFGQSYALSDLDGQTIETCTGALCMGDYAVGEDIEVTFCSYDEINTHLEILINGDYSFPEGASSLCIYDGATTADPLLVCYDYTSVVESKSVKATSNNESGCLTLKFVGADSTVVFNAHFDCKVLCMPREVFIVSVDPESQLDGYINLCWNDELEESMPVELTAEGNYPETGYSCSDENNIFYWDFDDGTPIQYGQGLTNITHSFQGRSGHEVRVSIVDTYGCYNLNTCTQGVRVSLLPNYAQTSASADPTAICMGELVDLCCEYPSSLWINEYTPVLGPTDEIPDNTGYCYVSPITETQFNEGDTLESIFDLNGIWLNLEHSFAGDLTIDIQCPNKQSVNLKQMAGSGTFLGEPIDGGPYDDNLVPGVGYWYCFSPDASQTMAVASSNYLTLPAGEYASNESLTSLIGCPLNGQWAISICDNLSHDDGYIFGWYLDVDDDDFNDDWQYSNEYSSPSWSGLFGSQIDEPNDQNCAVGTYLTTNEPNYNSNQPFIFNVIDDYGCMSDTVLYVNVSGMSNSNCCILPDAFAGDDDSICDLIFNLAATLSEGNTGFWSLQNGPGIAEFSNAEAPSSLVTVSQYGVYVFKWTEQSLGSIGCVSSSTVTISFVETFNPTLGFFSNMCVGEPPMQLSALSFGTLQCAPNPSLLDSESLMFYPNIPGTYTITNTLIDPCSNETLVSSIEFVVNDIIEVVNFTEECGPSGYNPDDILISWDVVNSSGDPVNDFLINGLEPVSTSFHYDSVFVSPSDYDFIITDVNSCTSIALIGYKDCSCPLFAGTMTSLATVFLCEDQCTGSEVSHNSDQDTDSGAGVFEFIIHEGDNIPLAYSSSTDFCLNDFGGNYNTVYYISSICGISDIFGHAELTGCYSISQASPVKWLENPISEAGNDLDTCGNLIQLNANEPEIGQYGYWTSDLLANTVYGTNANQANVWFLADDNSDYTFIWHVANGNCISEDDVIVGFNQIPSPYAGEDRVLCGYDATLQAVASMSGTTYSWFGDFVEIDFPDSISTNVHVDYLGAQGFTFIESNGSCIGSDEIVVNFFLGPQTMVSVGIDTACGNSSNLEAYNVMGSGYWTAYEDGSILEPQPTFLPAISSPYVEVIADFNGAVLSHEIDFVWTETSSYYGVECTGQVSKQVVFLRKPNADAGSAEFVQVCGTCIQLNADTTDSDWAIGIWNAESNPALNEISFSPDSLDSNAELCVDFNESNTESYVDVEAFWSMSYEGCSSIDMLYVRFNKHPIANAGSDTLFCGLGGDVVAIPSYGYGTWSTDDELSLILGGDDIDASVVAFEYNNEENPYYTLVWTENNTTGCVDSDTLLVTFVSPPETPLCPDDMILYDDMPVVLTGASPDGGYFSGDLVEDNVFYPSGESGAYNIAYIITNEDDCQSYCEFEIVVSVGIDEDENLKINIYPNPNKGTFIVELKSPESKVMCNVFNAIGDIVFEKEFKNKEELEINIDVAPGVYYIKLIDQKNTIIEKVVVE